MTDSTGAVKNTYAYDPWGNSLGKTEAVSNPWQFASGYLDATTGLYKFGTRYYSPTLGRWTQKDPVGGSVGKVGSGNAYVYADDAPVMMTDPSGRFSIGCNLAVALNFFAIGVSISGIIGTLTLGVPTTVLGLDAALGALALTGVVFFITALAVAAIFFAAYEIVQSISTVRSACSS